MTNELEFILDEIKNLDIVADVSIWKDKRAYIKLKSFDYSYTGCRNYQLYIDLETGELVAQMGKGLTTRRFEEHVEELKSAFDAAKESACETLPYGENTVTNINGKPVDMTAARDLMDDDICEALHGKTQSEQEFFEAYADLHAEKYGDNFQPYVGGAW